MPAQPPPKLKACEKICGGLFEVGFSILCFITGQLMLDCSRPNKTRNEPTTNEPTRNAQTSKLKVWITAAEVPFALVFFLFNIGVLAFNVYVIFIGCPYPYCGYIAGPFQINATTILIPDYIITPFQIFATNASTPTLIPGLTLQYINMQKVVVTMATLSGSLSYLIMMCIVITQYSFIHKYCENGIKAIYNFVRDHSSQYYDVNIGEDNNPSTCILNPFLYATEEDGDDYKKTVLHFPQLCCFYFFLILNILLFLGNAAVLYYILIDEDHIPKHKTHKKGVYVKDAAIDYAGVTAYFGSQICATISCFIFSKVTYAVTIECGAMMEKYRSECNNGGNEDEKLSRLQIEDKTFQKLSIRSMKPYRVWFTVHWLLYAITTFVSLAYLAETIINWLYGYWHYECTRICHLSIAYIFLFSLENTALFLYPCFRAASILSARNSLIKNVCNKEMENITQEKKFAFAQYMKERKCGFVLSIFCAHIEFGFNIAYISIFIGFLGIIIKLTL